MAIIKSLLIDCCKPIIHYQHVFLYACLLPCNFLLVRLSTTQQPSGNEKGIHEAFMHLMTLIVGDVTRLKYLVCLALIWLLVFHSLNYMMVVVGHHMEN